MVTLPVAADYDVTGRTFPTGHMRVMPHTDMSALTLLFQRVGKPSRRCDAFVYAPDALSCQSLDTTSFPQTPTPFTPSCISTGLPPPFPLVDAPLL